MATHSTQVFLRGQAVTVEAVMNAMLTLPQGNPSEEYIYLLVLGMEEELAPAYIGRAKDPVVRWKQHLIGLQRGKGSYQRWCDLLLNDDGTARHDAQLVVVPVADVTEPPIPGFPATVGSLEYQLVGLAADAYPTLLLNHEGSSR